MDESRGGRAVASASVDPAPAKTHFVSAASLRERLDWLNRLRWGAAGGVAAGALVAGPWLGLALPLRGLFGAAALLAVLNGVYVLRNRRRPAGDIASELRFVKVQMVVDLLILTALLNFTGGLENPFFFLYTIHVILASLLFRGRDIFRIAGLAIVLFSGMVVGEYLGVLPHRHVAGAGELGHGLPFVVAGLGAFWLVMLTCAYLGASIMAHNRAIKDDLVRRQEELEVAAREKLDFFRFVTHEVKSPVGTAQSAVQAVLEAEGAHLEDPARGLLERDLARLDQATRIVQGLADLTRGGGLAPAADTVVDLNAAGAAVCARLRDDAGPDRELVWRPAPGAAAVRGDPDMIDKVLANLVGNALRYGGSGPVTVAVVDGPAEVAVSVADRGPGIAPAEQERIFDEFYRTASARETSRLGTGLGLAIVRRFMARMGGRVTVESQLGVGSVFRAAWPRAGGGAS